MGPVADDPSSLPQPSVNQNSRPLSEEQLDGILSPELDKMVTDGAILGKLYKIPELGGKDVEDLFTAVLSPVTTQPPALPQSAPTPAPQLLPLHSQDVFSRMPLMNGLIGPGPHLPHTPLPPGNGLGTFSTVAQAPYTDARYLKAVTFSGNSSNFRCINASLLLCTVSVRITFIVVFAENLQPFSLFHNNQF